VENQTISMIGLKLYHKLQGQPNKKVRATSNKHGRTAIPGQLKS